MSTKSTSKSSSRAQSSKEDQTIIGIDLGTIFSCVGIMRKRGVDIVPEANSGKNIVPSIVCFTPDKLIGTAARNRRRELPESSMFESKRLLGHKYSNPNVQEDIKRWPIKIIEDTEYKKPKYVVKVKDKISEYFPEDVSAMILEYLKEQAEIYNGNKPIKRAVITVPAHFNNLQREATIEAAEKAGLEVYKLINEPTAAAIAYGDIIQSKKERKVLIFDIGGGTFDASIVKIKGNEYTVLASQGEEHLGGEDFNQRLYDYVIEEIKNDKDFEKIDFYKNKKDDVGMLQTIKRIRSIIEEVKFELTLQKEGTFFYDNLCGIKNFRLIITRNKFEELCMDLWKKCLNKVQEACKIARLDKKDIDEIILVGGSTRIPKIRQMVKDFFEKEPLRNINADEVVAYGATLAAYLNELDIKDTTSKNIGISVGGGKMDTIIPRGLQIPFVGKNLLKYEKEYTLGGKKNQEKLTVNVYEGNGDKVSENDFLGKFTVDLGEKGEEKKIKISMILDNNSILKVKAKVNDGKDNEIKIKMDINE